VSFGEIFEVNCLQNGMLVVTLSDAIVHDLWRQLRQRPGAEITIDLPQQLAIAPDGSAHAFDISALRKDRLIRGIDDIDMTLAHADAIAEFEARRRAEPPWLPTARRE
jgi:3-isopropylmalate/(R)-2-methylmalate dehydratase small subunit